MLSTYIDYGIIQTPTNSQNYFKHSKNFKNLKIKHKLFENFTQFFQIILNCHNRIKTLQKFITKKNTYQTIPACVEMCANKNTDIEEKLNVVLL